MQRQQRKQDADGREYQVADTAEATKEAAAGAAASSSSDSDDDLQGPDGASAAAASSSIFQQQPLSLQPAPVPKWQNMATEK